MTAPVPLLSILLPAYNEEACIASIVRETACVLHGLGRPFEILVVDDGSTDATPARLKELAQEIPELRVLRLAANSGQSAALGAAFRAARGGIFVTLDADGQNDPADIPKLLAARDAAAPQVKLFAGWRVDRQDSGSKRWASRWANRIRTRMLRDDTPDTGCGIKLFERAVFLELPYFDHMHRYLPALVQRAGWQSTSVPVAHRPRTAGVSKYNNLGRALVGIRDLLGVSWLIARSRRTTVEER